MKYGQLYKNKIYNHVIKVIGIDRELFSTHYLVKTIMVGSEVPTIKYASWNIGAEEWVIYNKKLWEKL